MMTDNEFKLFDGISKNLLAVACQLAKINTTLHGRGDVSKLTLIKHYLDYQIKTLAQAPVSIEFHEGRQVAYEDIRSRLK